MNLLTVKQVSQKLNVAVSYVWRLAAKDPAFPKPIHLGNPEGPRRARVTRWVEEDVTTWLASKQQPQGPNDTQRSSREVHRHPGEEVPAEG